MVHKSITSKKIISLYTKKRNEKVIALGDAPGITIIKPYPKNVPEKSDFRMFVRFYLLENNIVHWGVNMIEQDTGYIREDKKYLTSFSLEPSDWIIFDVSNNKIMIKRWLRRHKFTVNQFVDLLTKNHLKNRNINMIVREKIKIYFLQLIFWLVDKKIRLDWISKRN